MKARDFFYCLAAFKTIYMCCFSTEYQWTPRCIFNDLKTMRRSPRRPLILRRKLPFQQNDPPAAGSPSQPGAPGCKEPPKSAASQSFLNGIHILDHPSMSDTQVVVIPKTADLQSVIGALTAKGKECGVQGPNKFILLSGNGSTDGGSFCQPAAAGDEVSTAGQPVKADTVHSPDAKALTGIKTCMEIILFSLFFK